MMIKFDAKSVYYMRRKGKCCSMNTFIITLFNTIWMVANVFIVGSDSQGLMFKESNENEEEKNIHGRNIKLSLSLSLSLSPSFLLW